MIQVGVVMGSNSDWEVMQNAARVLKDFGVAFETRVVSAHRTPDLLFEYAETAEARGVRTGDYRRRRRRRPPAGHAGGQNPHSGAGRAGASKYLRGEDSLLSIVQMPRGIPASFAVARLAP